MGGGAAGITQYLLLRCCLQAVNTEACFNGKIDPNSSLESKFFVANVYYSMHFVLDSEWASEATYRNVCVCMQTRLLNWIVESFAICSE